MLVADDEEMVRDFCRAVLSGQGFDVFVAADGQQALEIFKTEKGRFDLVLLDMLMPRMNGEIAFQKMRELNPGVRVVLSSGYSEDSVTQSLFHARRRRLPGKTLRHSRSSWAKSTACSTPEPDSVKKKNPVTRKEDASRHTRGRTRESASFPAAPAPFGGLLIFFAPVPAAHAAGYFPSPRKRGSRSIGERASAETERPKGVTGNSQARKRLGSDRTTNQPPKGAGTGAPSSGKDGATRCRNINYTEANKNAAILPRGSFCVLRRMDFSSFYGQLAFVLKVPRNGIQLFCVDSSVGFKRGLERAIM
ncbi:MAG: response regulator [Deltaproteobacteria bacterium]|nr:response regulator [Deltaproteobacteria bacterium]